MLLNIFQNLTINHLYELLRTFFLLSFSLLIDKKTDPKNDFPDVVSEEKQIQNWHQMKSSQFCFSVPAEAFFTALEFDHLNFPIIWFLNNEHNL